MADAPDVRLAAVRIIDLARDWERYGKILDPAWRDCMRRAVVIELRCETQRLADACGGLEE